jgi:hypothetical protein
LSEKGNSLLRLLKNKSFKEESMTKVGVYAIDTSTTLESNKSHCRYDWRTRKVTDIRDGVWYATSFASPQTSLLPFNAQETLVLYCPRPLRPQARLPVSAQQLWLFALVPTG